MAARDSGQRPQSILSLAERSDSEVMSMHKELSVKSRVRGDFHARFCERVRVKLPRSTRPGVRAGRSDTCQCRGCPPGGAAPR